MGERGVSGACPSPAGPMHTLGIAVSLCAFFFECLLIWRGAAKRLFGLFPLFYSYIGYIICGVVGMYLVYWLDRKIYPSAYWIYYLVSILVEFTVLVEISDHIFQLFPAIRSLGRALTWSITAGLGAVYIVPAMLEKAPRSQTLLDITLRASVTKGIILLVLFYVARHYGCQLGRNLGGLMLGFSVYVAINAVVMASARVLGSATYAQVLWVMSPMTSALCTLVWAVSLWEPAPAPVVGSISTVAAAESVAVELELTRLNSELSKILHK